MPEQFDQEFWDARYRSTPALWSGRANPALVDEVDGLDPGRALEAGCGEGADAIWLAQRGWRVTAVDVSPVALGRGATAAEALGPEVAGRIEWVVADVTAWEPGVACFDLVSAQYLHLPSAVRGPVFEGLARAVAVGGTLVIVGHDVSDHDTTMHRPHEPDLFFTSDDIASTLDADGWVIVTRAAPGRTATDPDGHPVTVHDTVLRARRAAGG